MQRRVVTYKLVGPGEIELDGRQIKATEVVQQFAGIDSRLWLDRRGRVLREQLPMSVRIDHESWER